MLQDDPPKKHYWAFYVLTATIFLLIIYIFIMNKNTHHYSNIVDPLTFLYYGVFPPSLFTFITYQIFPKEFEGIDLKVYLMRYRSRVIVPLIIYITVNLIELTGGIDLGTVIGAFVTAFAASVVVFERYWLLEAFVIIFLIGVIGGYLI